MEAPDILFWQETRLRTNEFELCKFRLGFSNCLVVDCRNRKGGIALLWSRNVNLSIVNYSHCHIDALIDDDLEKGSWFFTGIYSFPEVSQRVRTWELLCVLCRQNREAWLVIGDFNEILHNYEKWGGRQRPNWISAFRDVVNDCVLRELGLKGNKFTWSNRRGGPHRNIERLDRALANSHWCGKFSNASVTHELEAYSDHVPIWINTEGDGSFSRRRREFKFEEMWVGEHDCDDIIKTTWENGEWRHHMLDIMSKIKECGRKLNNWNHHSFGNVQKQLHLARQRMKALNIADPVGELSSEHERARDEVQKWLERDEVMWRQMSKVYGLRAVTKT